MQGVRRQGKARVHRARAVVGLALGVATWAAVGLPASGAAESSGDSVDRPAVEASSEDGEASAGQRAGEELLVVAERDTLWDLAREHAPDDMDRREWAAEVADRNGIDPREIRPGDALRVPAELLSGAVGGGS